MTACISQRILDVVACPRCGGALAPLPSGLGCIPCSAEYPTHEGIVVLRERAASAGQGPDLSVLLLTLNEGPNLRRLVPAIRCILDDLGCSYEIIVMDGGSRDETERVCEDQGVRLERQSRPGYGQAYREGIGACRGERVLTMDADMSHDPGLVRVLWRERVRADLVIGSRYTWGGGADTEWFRKLLSRILNEIFRVVTGTAIRDLSSGYRLFRRAVLDSIPLRGRDFDVVVEASAEIAMRDFEVRELPMYYKPRGEGVSKVRLARFARSYARLLFRLLSDRLHNLKDAGAHALPVVGNALQQARLRLVRECLAGDDEDLILLGEPPLTLARAYPSAIVCASSEIVLNRLGRCCALLVEADASALPLRGGAGRNVIWCGSGNLLEDSRAFDEVRRVCRAGGRIVVIESRLPAPLRVQTPLVARVPPPSAEVSRGMVARWNVGGVETVSLYAGAPST